MYLFWIKKRKKGKLKGLFNFISKIHKIMSYNVEYGIHLQISLVEYLLKCDRLHILQNQQEESVL